MAYELPWTSPLWNLEVNQVNFDIPEVDLEIPPRPPTPVSQLPAMVKKIKKKVKAITPPVEEVLTLETDEEFSEPSPPRKPRNPSPSPSPAPKKKFIPKKIHKWDKVDDSDFEIGLVTKKRRLDPPPNFRFKAPRPY